MLITDRNAAAVNGRPDPSVANMRFKGLATQTFVYVGLAYICTHVFKIGSHRHSVDTYIGMYICTYL